MSSFLSLSEASKIVGCSEEQLKQQFIDSGILSAHVNAGEITIERSELSRVFPEARLAKPDESVNYELELQLKQLQIENLEYKVASLERQLLKQAEEYAWLRGKFDNTALLLEQKLDTSEVDQYKQEIRTLAQQALQWEKKYNMLLAANEVKSLVRENRELKEQLTQTKPNMAPEISQPTASSDLPAPDYQQQLAHQQQEIANLKAQLHQLTTDDSATELQTTTSEIGQPLAKRRKILGIF
jgi:predicted  nucleic acid-binding Zn-ribbon protein